MNSNEDKKKFMNQLNDAIQFLIENKSDIDEEISEVSLYMEKMNLQIHSIDANISNLLNSLDKNYELFSPNVKGRNEQVENLNMQKNALEKEKSQVEIKLSNLYDRQNNLLYSINFLRLLKDDSNKIHRSSTIEGLKILETQENERSRIARDLHDSTVQNLTNIMHKTELCSRLIDIDSIRAKLELQTMIGTIKSTINDMRNIIYNLRPMSFDDLGFITTIDRFIKEYNKSKDVNILFHFEEQEIEILPVVRLTLFRIIQEAVSNAVKHGKAKNIVIDFFCRNNLINLDISDDGCGFDQSKCVLNNNDILSGFGLSIMRERVLLLSGNINIVSNENGTKISVKVPLKNNKEGF
jgi:Signal transduction histidine kinase